MKPFITGLLLLLSVAALAQPTNVPADSSAKPNNPNRYNLSVVGGQAFYKGSSGPATLYVQAQPMSLAQTRAISSVSRAAIPQMIHITDSGKEGIFAMQPVTSTLADNTGTVLLTANGIRYKRVYSGAVDSKWFSCQGDSLTDDTANLQLAINNSGPAATVFISAGTYRTTAALTIPDGVVVRFAKTAKIITAIAFSATTVRGNDGTYVFLPGNGSQIHDALIDLKNTANGGISLIQVNGSLVRGCTVKNMNTASARFGFALVGGDHHHLENNNAYDLAHGFNVFRSDYSTITGNVTNRTFSGIYTAASNHCFISNNTTENCADVGIDVERSQHTFVFNNHAAFCKVAEFSLFDGGAENNDQPPQLDIVFSGNTAHRGSSYIVANPTGTTSATAACDNDKGAYSVISSTTGCTGIVFENNKAQVDYAYGFYHTLNAGSKTGRSIFFRNNTVYSSAGFLNVLDCEGLTIADNLFIGLPGSETVTNVIREGHRLVFTDNTFRYINPKTTNYAINQYTQTGYATIAPYYARNTFINCGTWAFQVDSFQNGSLTPILDKNSFSVNYVSNGGLNITGNGNAKLVNQNLKLLFSTGTTALSSITGIQGAAWGKASGDMIYGRVGYSGVTATLSYIYGSGSYLTVLNTVNGLTIAISSNSLVLTDNTGGTTFCSADIVVNSL